MEGKLRKRSKKRRTRRKATNKKDTSVKRDDQFSLHEVSLDDFANAPSKDDVFKKVSKKMVSSTGSFALLRQPEKLENVKELADVVKASDDESPWYDRLDIGESEDESRESEEVDEDSESLKTDPALSDTGNDEHTNIICEASVHHENCYPLDLWCILANYIKPEQIQTFASICRGSYQAVSTISFWCRLYERFTPNNANLPARLKSDWIESRDGYKCRVVRALFIAYQSLHYQLEQLTLQATRDTNVTSKIVGLRCSRAWYGRNSNSPKTFVFYFKFKLNEHSAKISLCEWDERFEYLNANSERDFIVFRIIVSNFIRIPSVSGESLTDISVNLSRNLRFHCIKMTFHTFRHDGRYRKGDGKVIVLDPVSEFRLLRWWYPLYPHCGE